MARKNSLLKKTLIPKRKPKKDSFAKSTKSLLLQLEQYINGPDDTLISQDPTLTYIPSDTFVTAKKCGLLMQRIVRVDGYEPLLGYGYVQQALSKIKLETVMVHVVPTSQAPALPGLKYINEDFAVMWGNVAVAFDYGRKLWRLGLLDGNEHEVKVCKPPEYGPIYTIQAPYQSWGDACARCENPPSLDEKNWTIGAFPQTKPVKELEEEKERRRQRTVYIPGTKWVGDKLEGHMLMELDLLPPPPKSKAKPHILVRLGGVTRAEITARQDCYARLRDICDNRSFPCSVYVSPSERADSNSHSIVLDEDEE